MKTSKTNYLQSRFFRSTLYGSRLSVIEHVILVIGKQSQIFKAVVILYPVNVMHRFFFSKKSAKVFLYDQTMFADTIVFVLIRMFRRIDTNISPEISSTSLKIIHFAHEGFRNLFSGILGESLAFIKSRIMVLLSFIPGWNACAIKKWDAFHGSVMTFLRAIYVFSLFNPTRISRKIFATLFAHYFDHLAILSQGDVWYKTNRTLTA